MPLLFDNRNWNAIIQATQQFANMQTAMKSVNLISYSDIQQQISIGSALQQYVNRQQNIIGSALQQYVNRQQNTIGSAFQQYANQSNLLVNHAVQRYIEQLQTDLLQEPEDHEVLEQPEEELIRSETRERIVIYSPSLLLLEKLRAQRISLHDLTWRQFEEVLAELLIKDGFTVELGRGTKDDGKDIVAVKEVRGFGLVMSIWQAKKLNIGNKVGISVIRELADTRNKLDASKGVIVTTTSLTRGALQRIEQDRFLLHKVDGNDLLTWIQQTQ